MPTMAQASGCHPAHRHVFFFTLLDVQPICDRYWIPERGCWRRSFLLESLRATSNETIQHGAGLGLGLAGLGTQDEELFEDLKGVLYTDSAVSKLLSCCGRHPL